MGENMHPNFCIGNKGKQKTVDDLSDLIDEFIKIKNDREYIRTMEIENTTREVVYADLDKQIANVKERMHNTIDEM